MPCRVACSADAARCISQELPDPAFAARWASKNNNELGADPRPVESGSPHFGPAVNRRHSRRVDQP